MTEKTLYCLDILDLLVELSSLGNSEVMTLDFLSMSFEELRELFNPFIRWIYTISSLKHHIIVLRISLLLICKDHIDWFLIYVNDSILRLLPDKLEFSITFFVGSYLCDISESQSYCVLDSKSTLVKKLYQRIDLQRMGFSNAEDLFKFVSFVNLMRSDVFPMILECYK